MATTDTETQAIQRALAKAATKAATAAAPPRGPLGVAKTWDPDRRWLHPVVAVLWTYVLGWIPIAFKFSPWVMVLVGAVAVGGGVHKARRVYTEQQYGHRHAAAAEAMAASAGVAATAWWVYAGHVWPTNLTALGLLVVAGVVFGGCYLVVRSKAPARARAQELTYEANRELTFNRMWAEILERAGLPGCRVVKRVDHRAGYSLAITSKDKPITEQAIKSRLDSIIGHAATALAKHRITLGPKSIKVEATDAAHVVLLHVTIRAVITQAIPYPAHEPVRSIRQGLDLGLYEDGLVLHLDLLRGQLKIVGATQSGKSTLLRVLIGKGTRTSDTDVWVGATNKLIPLVFRWLEPWFDGSMKKPLLGYVAGQNPNEVLRMLSCAYRVMKERNSALSVESAFEPTPKDPAILVLLEEASDFLTRPDKITTFDGREMTASQLVHELTMASASAAVIVALASQFGLVEMYGRYGSEMNRNLTIRICLKTLTYHDGTQTLVGLNNAPDTTKLLHHSMLVQPSTKEARVLPAKGYRLEDDQVPAIAIYNGEDRPELPEGLAKKLGPDYAGRWDAQRLPELYTACRKQGYDWAGTGVDNTDDPEGFNEQFDQIVKRLEENQTMNSRSSEPPADNPAGLPDVSDAIAELHAIAARTGRTAGDQGGQPAEERLPEPLRSIVQMLDAPNAPKVDWISTGKLAIVIGWVANDAPEAEVEEAAERLGRKLSILVPNLKSRQRRVSDGSRPRGYDVARLRAAADAIRRGEELAPE